MLRSDHNAELGGPARQVLATLARRGELAISELVSELGVTTTAVRQQVNRLVGEEWLESGKRRGGPGRPADVFRLTDKARRLFSQGADDLCRLVLEETASIASPEQFRQIMDAVSRRMAERFRAGLEAGEDPLPGLAALLNARGLLAEAGESQGRSLTVYTCPFPELVGDHPEICELERAAVSELAGAPIRLERCRSEGQSRCEFHVCQHEPEETASAPVSAGEND